MSSEGPADFRKELANEVVACASNGDIDAAIALARPLIEGAVSEPALSLYQWSICQNLIYRGEATFVAWFLERTERFLPRPHREPVASDPSCSRGVWFYHCACRQANLAVMELLVRRYGMHPAASIHTDTLGNSLNTATLSESVPAVRWLLDNGVPANLDYHGRSVSPALLLAAGDGLTDICRLLVERGTHVNFLNLENMSPLDLAEIDGHEETSAYLRSVGAQPGWQLRGEPNLPATSLDTSPLD